jgi:hypothetical protein
MKRARSVVVSSRFGKTVVYCQTSRKSPLNIPETVEKLEQMPVLWRPRYMTCVSNKA